MSRRHKHGIRKRTPAEREALRLIAQALGREGGKKGGKARFRGKGFAGMTAERRREVALMGVEARRRKRAEALEDGS